MHGFIIERPLAPCGCSALPSTKKPPGRRHASTRIQSAATAIGAEENAAFELPHLGQEHRYRVELGTFGAADAPHTERRTSGGGCQGRQDIVAQRGEDTRVPEERGDTDDRRAERRGEEL